MSDIAPAAEQPTAETNAQKPLWRGRHGYVRKTPRTIAPIGLRRGRTAFERAVRQALPWTRDNYPGLYAGMEEMLGNRAGRETVKCWLSGRRSPPDWAREMVAAWCCERARALTAASEALTSAPPRQRGGWARIDPVTGLDGRARIGRRGKRKEL